MRPSFAHFAAPLYVAAGLLLAGCASLPPPTAELAAAQQAVARADAADADQYAPAQIAQARSALAAAQSAMARGREGDARTIALAAAADADLARVLSGAEQVRAEVRQHQGDIAGLRARLQAESPPEEPSPLDLPTPTAPAAQRLQVLESDPRLNPFAQFERLQARQALASAEVASRGGRDAALQLAEQRTRIAELAARVEAARRQVDRLERERSDLLVEASRRDAERARAEAERLRLEAQVQAEEAARLRAQAEQAEAVLDTARIDQDARVADARAKEAALARQEAELVAGAPVPRARREGDQDVYVLAGDAFPSGQSSLTAGAAASVQALGVYLATLGSGSIQVLGHTDSQGGEAANLALSQRRADAVAAALAQAGVTRELLTPRGQGQASPIADNSTAEGRARNRRVEIVVSDKR